MKMWLAALGTLALVTSTAWSAPLAPVPVKDADGKTYALIVFCNDCENPSKSGCFDGAESGWLKGKPCGKCFLDHPAKRPIEIPYDLHVFGKITNAKGEAVKERFVKLFMINGWGHRTRTFDDGRFHLTLGATGERKDKEKKVLDVDLGTLVDSVGDKDEFFAMFMVSPDFKPCDAPAKASK